MIAKSVEDLQVYQRALELANEVSGLLTRPSLRREYRLREQLGTSSAAVAALIAEGFRLSTDRHFAALLYRARAESTETRTHLRIVAGRRCLSETELRDLLNRYDQLERMLTALIRHLEREDRKQRG